MRKRRNTGIRSGDCGNESSVKGVGTRKRGFERRIGLDAHLKSDGVCEGWKSLRGGTVTKIAFKERRDE